MNTIRRIIQSSLICATVCLSQYFNVSLNIGVTTNKVPVSTSSSGVTNSGLKLDLRNAFHKFNAAASFIAVPGATPKRRRLLTVPLPVITPERWRRAAAWYAPLLVFGLPKDMGGSSLLSSKALPSPGYFSRNGGETGTLQIREKASAFSAAPLFELRIRGYAANFTIIPTSGVCEVNVVFLGLLLFST